MTHDLKTSLDDLAEAEYAGAPLSTVDIGKARAEGRRRMLTARLAPIGGGVAVVAACALVVNGLGGTSPAKPGSSPQQTSAAAGHTFTGTDPLTAPAKFGWLPDGFQTSARMAGADYGYSVTASAKLHAATGILAADAYNVVLLKWAAEPPLAAGQSKAPASVTGSSNAYYLVTAGDTPSIPSEVGLTWQTASGSWFSLTGNLQPRSDLKAQLLKIADSVRAEDTAVAMPIHIEGMPADVTLGETNLNDPLTVGSGGFTAGMSYHSGNAGPGTGRYFSITVAPTGQKDPDPVHADPNLAAKPGIPVQKAVPTPNTCKDSEGLHICVQDDPAQSGPDPLASVGGAQGLLDRITSLGTNRANWTTHVVN